MGKSATNITIVLGLVIIAFGAYYLYTKNASVAVDFDRNEQSLQDMLDSSQIFIARNAALDQVNLETEFFEDKRFLSLRKFSTDVKARPIGRPNPFAEVNGL